jgi:hypothetical protein
MNIKKSLAMILALSFGVIGSASIQAAVITFDDLPNVEFADAISDGYQGFDWSWFNYIDKFALPNTGFEQGVVSGKYAAYNDFAATATTSSSLFDFNGAYLTGAWNDGLKIEVTGFLGGIARYSKTVEVNTAQAQWFTFNFFGLDSLSFFSFGGTRNLNTDGEGEHFILDNFTYNEPIAQTKVSEPASSIMFGLGILIIALLMNRKPKNINSASRS